MCCSTTTAPQCADTALHEELHAALSALDQVDREIIALVHWDGFALVEASRILGMKEGTVRSRYHRARAALRTQLTTTSIEAL